jgi:hypothetical protein
MWSTAASTPSTIFSGDVEGAVLLLPVGLWWPATTPPRSEAGELGEVGVER